ncbi:MAG: beta-ketoacyl-ACP synthase II [Actinophytocola sp.]|uniref:beta-ketoacyl-[acyl-carrier-protein] synthase family protein n=1 Tax=Actinophytocola sp. TaxID=1872138 RepID=UPI001321E67E|nr:beta-ketoacyl-[acyl-carrier-protein] synthase family protein [Actinophytocola sp.]MPZ83088.1 beta-ketoacyl-ACP synthase II [Actinophytocola sp.]
MPAERRSFGVAITGLGLVTPAGIGIDQNRDRVWSGISSATRDDALRGCPVDFSCRVPGFDADAMIGGFVARGLDRFAQLAIVAARQAVEDARLDASTWDGARVGVVLGNSLGGVQSIEAGHVAMSEGGPRKVSPLMVPRYMVNMVAAQVAIDLGARGPSQVTATACASGATAVGVARELLRRGACDVVITGGTEAALTPLAVSGLSRLGALSGRTDEPELASRPFDTDRDGFVPGEGAGVLILERVADARARGVPVRAVVRGYGASTDAHHPTAPAPGGEGIEQALRAALTDAGLGGSDVDHVNAHGTSTPVGDVVEGQMLRRVLGDRALVTSTKGVTGHPLAAAGAIEAGYTALAIQHGSVPPTANLTRLEPELDIDVVHGAPRAASIDVAVSTSMGFGGHNAALVLTAA